MGLSDAESDEVEDEVQACNVSFSDDIGKLGDSDEKEGAAKKEVCLTPVKVGDSFGKNVCKED